MRREWPALALCAVLMACGTGPAEPAGSPARFVQVTAHADDDIIFMNPDLATGIRAGYPTAGIYLTAGESAKTDAEAYAARRQAGTRAAYARMAGVADDWQAQQLDIGRRHAVELYTLRARPAVQVVFVNLPESNDPRPIGGREALVRLWQDDRNTLRIGTLVPAGGAVRKQYSYSRDDVVRLLVALFDRFRPTVIRAQDPAPDRRMLKDSPRFHDHPDHVMAARFTEAATRLYRGSRFVTENYRDYNVAEAPVNLSPPDRHDKVDIFSAYLPHDSETSLGPPVDGWLTRQYQRHPRGSSWAADGRAYVVFNGRLHQWDGSWKALPWADGPLSPAVSVAGARVVGRRGDEIVAFADGTWTSLGSPGPGDLGSPVATGNAVYVQNGRGRLSVWRSGRWTDLGGTDIQDGLAVSGADVYASTKDKVLHWHQDRLDPAFVSLVPAGPPAAAGPFVGYRTDSGEIALSRGGQPRLLPGLPGSGNPAVTAEGVVFARTSAGRLAASSGSGWRDLGGQVLDQPAATGAGVVALGPDGEITHFAAS
ncbi:MAG: PIG-L family deacetylase [Kibdelosporangium sp.]